MARALRAAGLLIAALLSASCTNGYTQLSLTGLSSFRVTLDSPKPDPRTNTVGTVGSPVAIDTATFDVEAIGPDGKRYLQACTVDADCCPAGVDCTQLTTASGRHPVCEKGTCGFDLDVFLSFAGNKVGQVDACGTGSDENPIATLHVSGGISTNNTVHLIKAFGAATIWIEEETTHALGTSPVIYFAQPTIPDIQDPGADQYTQSTFTWCSAWSGRHVIVDHARVDTRKTAANPTGAPIVGQIVVTSVFGTGYVVADTGAIYDPMTDTGGFNHLYVFSFGAPDPQIRPGVVLQDVSGNLAKFVGFMELNFPLQDYNYAAQLAKIPDVYPLQPMDNANELKLMRLDAATVSLTGKVCPITLTDPTWQKYNTFVVDQGQSTPCDSFSGFSVEIPGKTFGTFNPLTYAGGDQQFVFTGMLQNNSGQNPACKGTSGPLNVTCRSDADCVTASNTQSDQTCKANLAKSHCVEGACLRGVYNFWTVYPRTTDDIVQTM